MALGTTTVKATATPVATAAITSASFTPTADALVIAASFNTGGTSQNGQGTISSTHSPALTWTAITGTGGGNTTGGVRAWWAIAPSSPGAGTVTVTLGGTPTIQDLRVIETAGADPTTPIAGLASAIATTATTITVNLAATPAAGDRKVGLVVNRNKSTAPTVGSGFASVDSAASASPSASFLIETEDATDLVVDAANVGTTWSAILGFVVKAATGTPPAEDEMYLWDGSSLATSPRLDPYLWDGTTLQPLDAHSVA